MKAVPGILPTLLEMIYFFSTPTIDVEPKYDLLIGMDRANLRDMDRICGGDFADKIH